MCVEGIKLGGVRKIVLHNAKSVLRGSATVLCVFLPSSPFLCSLFFTFPACLKKGPSSWDNAFWVTMVSLP